MRVVEAEGLAAGDHPLTAALEIGDESFEDRDAGGQGLAESRLFLLDGRQNEILSLA